MKNTFIQTLKNTLTLSSLPSKKAHDIMRPQLVSGEKLNYNKNLEDYFRASVLLLLIPDQNTYFFPIIEKTIDGSIHSGQFALPGGKQEENEDDIECALREFKEEMGVNHSLIEVIGTLSPMPIAPSQYLVTPVIGTIHNMPIFNPDIKEVKNFFLIPINDLLNIHNQKTIIRPHRNAVYEIPYFDLNGSMVWGATAMILYEFLSIIKTIDPSDSNF